MASANLKLPLSYQGKRGKAGYTGKSYKRPAWIFLGWFLTKPHPNSVKTILGLCAQGGNSAKTIMGLCVQSGNMLVWGPDHIFSLGTRPYMRIYGLVPRLGICMVLPWFCGTKSMLKDEYNYCLNMGFVRQNQGRTMHISILDAQSHDDFYSIKMGCS